MLVFVVPLQSKAVSKSWERVVELVERSVRSACQQTSSAFRVIVVCHEKPELGFEHPNLSYAEVDFERPRIKPGMSAVDIVSQKDTDKGRKQLWGLEAAKQYNPTHTMLLDADDLVSNRLAEFVQQHPQANGWFFAKGYRYVPGSNWIYKKVRGFYSMCGSCNVLRYDLNPLPEVAEYNRGYGYYKFFIDHGKVPQILEKAGTPIAPLPFLGGVYVVQTGENIYFDSSKLYQGLGKYFYYRWVTPTLRAEFGL